MTNEQIKNFIQSCEADYESSLTAAIDTIAADRRIRFVLITGASCAGKTTTTRKTKAELEKRGIPAHFISLDDFYLPAEKVPLDEDGKPDFETIHSLDLDYIHDCMTDIMAGKTVMLPRFDFTKGGRDDELVPFSPSADDVIIIEGLHAMNPMIYKNYIPDEAVYKLYLYAKGNYQIRLLRRMIRDVNFRGTSAEETLDMWESVRKGEHKYIVPFKPDADMTINTYFEYEGNIFKEEGLAALGSVSKDNPNYSMAAELIAILENLEPIDRKYICENSLMWEFIKKV